MIFAAYLLCVLLAAAIVGGFVIQIAMSNEWPAYQLLAVQTAIGLATAAVVLMSVGT
jgi:hypothetical protein